MRNSVPQFECGLLAGLCVQAQMSYAEPGSMDELSPACKLAQAVKFISEFPNEKTKESFPSLSSRIGDAKSKIGNFITMEVQISNLESLSAEPNSPGKNKPTRLNLPRGIIIIFQKYTKTIVHFVLTVHRKSFCCFANEISNFLLQNKEINKNVLLGAI